MWLGLLLIIHCVFATTVQYNNIHKYECETNSNCTKIMANLICIKKKCICPFEYKLGGCIVDKTELHYPRQINYGKNN